MALENGSSLLSYEDFLRLPPESPGEVIHGELVVGPAPLVPHQRVVGNLYYLVRQHLETSPGLGEVFVAPLDVVLRAERPAIVLQPDLLFIAAARQGLLRGGVHGAPDLAIEVVSPGSDRKDSVIKRDLYAQFGVREFWLVWPGETRIDAFTLGEHGAFRAPRTYAPGETIETPLIPGLALAVDRVFGA